jgi:predicted amidohydrolase
LCNEAAEQADVVVLPELCTTGFCLNREQVASWAEERAGPTVSELSSVAASHNAVVVVGLALREADGTLRNGQVVIDADGRTAGAYFKHHLFEDDLAWATPGALPGGIVPTAVGDVGLLICHDLVYPTTVFGLAERRPRLLAVSTAWIGDGEPLPSPWSAVARVLAPAPVAIANRGGAEGAVQFRDPSAILVHGQAPVVGAQILYRAVV